MHQIRSQKSEVRSQLPVAGLTSLWWKLLDLRAWTPNRAKAVRRLGYRPQVEGLENRVVPAAIIIDDGAADFATAGDWVLSWSGQGFEDDVSFAAAGSGSNIASWSFTGLAPGSYRVSATWSENPNRATNAPFTVLDGDTVLGTVAVNQELAPDDFSEQGAFWKDLGNVTISGNTLVVQLSDNADDYVIADAIRIEPLGSVQIIDDGTLGFSTSGDWFLGWSGQGFQNDVSFATGTGSNAATWTFTGLAPGSYRVSATWSEHPNRATDAPYSVNGSPNILINQELAPDDLSDQGVLWENLGIFIISGGTITVTLSDQADGFVIADAIRIENVTIDFEDPLLALPPDSFYEGSDGAGGFESRGALFNNEFDPTFGTWRGWSYSNVDDVTTPGFMNQYAAYHEPNDLSPRNRGDDSPQYAVAFAFDPGFAEIVLPAGTMPASVRITNTTYAGLSMLTGDSFSKKFGGADGTDPDFFLLTIQGFDAASTPTGTVEFYLADFRFADDSMDYIVAQWTTVDLVPLGAADRLSFTLSSSDVGMFGMNTPAYFALDNLLVRT